MDGNPERWQPDQPAQQPQQPQQPQQAPAGPPFDYGQAPSSGGYPAGGMPSSGGQPPGVSGPGGGLPPAALVGIGVIAVLVLAIGGVLLMGSGDSDDDSDDNPDTETASDVQDEEAPADDGSTGDGSNPDTTAPADDGTSDEGGAGDGTDGGEGGGHWDVLDPASLPAPEIPGEAEAERPELRPEHDGMEHPYNPFDDEYWPIIGEVYADTVPGEHLDIPVYLEAGEVAVMFNANDEVYSEVEIYDPNGEVIATAEELGEPEVVEGYEFSEYSDDALTEAGVYVFRVIQHTGVEGGFPIRFFTPDGPGEGE